MTQLSKSFADYKDEVKFHAINDFSLFSEKTVMEDLENVLQQWLEWQ